MTEEEKEWRKEGKKMKGVRNERKQRRNGRRKMGRNGGRMERKKMKSVRNERKEREW